MSIYTKLCTVFLWFFLLTACVSSGPKTLSFSEAQLQKKLAERLDTPITLIKVIQAELRNPQIVLDENTNRLNALFDTQLTSPLFPKTMTGKLHISGVVRYLAEEQSVILDEPKIEAVTVNGVDNQYNQMLSEFGKKMGSQLLPALTLYHVKSEDLVHGGMHYAPQTFNIIGHKLEITLMPTQPEK